MHKKVITIFTANSNTGSACLKDLVDKHSNRFRIRAVFRTPEKSKTFEIIYPDIEIVTGCDADRTETLDKAFVDSNYALIVTPFDANRGFSQDARLTCNMIEAAVRHNVEYIVLVTSWAAKYPNELPLLSSRFVPSEKLLIKYSTQKNLKYTIIRSSCLMENFILNVKKAAETSVFTYPDITCPYIDTRDIGRCAAACLSSDDILQHDKKVYELSGPEVLNGDKMAKIMSKVYNENVRYQPASRSIARKVMPEAIAEAIEFMIENKDCVPFTNTVKDLIGQCATFEDFLRDHLFEINNNLMKLII